jgi:hypothetical protein
MEMKLVADNHLGVYIPQFIAESGLLSVGGIDMEDVEILLDGPDHEWYWETWDTVLNNFRTESGEILYTGECGDVFLALPEEVEEE